MYLPPPAPDGYRLTDLPALAKPHPARPALAADEARDGTDHTLFWSLSFRRAVDEHAGSWEADTSIRPARSAARTYNAAVAFLEQTRTEMRQRTWIDPARGEITLSAC